VEKIQTKVLRTSLGDVLNKTQYADESFVITRRDEDIAVLLSIQEWKRVEKAFRDLDELKELKK
jgi:prevent-host-death family protein